MKRCILALASACALLLFPLSFAADDSPLAAETLSVAVLGEPTPHWLFINDTNFLGYMDSKVYLVDADTGRTLGMMSTGGYRGALEFAPGLAEIYSPETYYPRVTRGERTEVVSIYDPKSLQAVDEVVIPPIRATGAMHRGYQGISDDGRFVYVANQTPAMSVSVVDIVARKFVEQIETSGCIIIMPTGDRTFAVICGNGTLMHVRVGDDGKFVSARNTAPFFDANEDPVTEKVARIGNTWYLTTFRGVVHSATLDGDNLSIGGGWRLTTDAEFAQGWRPGGQHFTAVHEATGRLYVVMNARGEHAHKDAGSEVWVFDAATGRRLLRFGLPHPATQIAVSQDSEPLLVAGGEGPVMHVMDAMTGALLRPLQGSLLGPGIMQFPVR
jgi:methylamine dehydrogenase heavy chain